ncbi:MAG: hypothetical protein E4G90_00395 [Gemmatimonadales bacterium]|nr:MAG: hypothetical protein E4G90_00395 [Gemmatimonadales bacterium]
MSQIRNRVVTAVVIVGFVAILIWSTIAAQTVECQVCVTLAGTTNCATATAASETEAARSAQTTACGPLTRGMNDAIACGNIVPETRVCRTR